MSENRIMECPGCGARISSSKRICDYCGNEIKVPEEKNESTDVASEIQNNQQFQPRAISQPYNGSAYNQTPQKTISSMAIVSFILSLVGFSPIAFILGIIASIKISKPDSNLTGKGFAAAAIIISVIQVLILIIIISTTQ